MGRKSNVRKQKQYFQWLLEKEKTEEAERKAKLTRRVEIRASKKNSSTSITSKQHHQKDVVMGSIKVKKPRSLDKKTKRFVRQRQNAKQHLMEVC